MVGGARDGFMLTLHFRIVRFRQPMRPGCARPLPQDNEGVTSCGVTRNTRTDDVRLEPADGAYVKERGSTYKP